MFKISIQNILLKSLDSSQKSNLYLSRRFISNDTLRVQDLNLRRAIIVRKVTRYEYEKYILKPNLSENDLKKYINNKGSNYDFLLVRHQEYVKSLILLKKAFEKRSIDFKIFQRYNFRPEFVQWADAIFSLGGDGTFLLAATMIQQSNKPLIGFNSDLTRSEGFLCLPHEHSLDFNKTLDKLINHEFSWFKRTRIRLKIESELEESHFNLYDDTKEVILQDISDFEDSTNISQILNYNSKKIQRQKNFLQRSSKKRHFPILSLNEVFIGEKLSARVSYYELSINGSVAEKQKSSGLMVCPGTGSTSWFFNSNNITKSTVKDILSIAQKYQCCTNANLEDEQNISRIVNDYNNALMFAPDEEKMGYSVRDPLARGVYTVNTESRGFCNNLKVKSRMYDACIVVDGGQSFAFNDGALVTLSIHPEDSLLCVKIL